MTTAHLCTISCLFGFVLAGALEGQELPSVHLSSPERVSEQAFSRVAGIKELPSGRIILLDKLERLVVLLESDLTEGRLLGRSGSGPKEYLAPSRLLSTAGDTAALWDLPNRRFLMVGPDGGIGGVLNFRAGVGSLTASDGLGRFYSSMRVSGQQAIVRWSPRDQTVDTMAFYPLGSEARPPGVVYNPVDANPFPVNSEWAVAADGRIAIVQPEPYQVAIIDADGVRRVGPVIPVDPVKVEEAHKEAWRESRTRPGFGLLFEPNRWPKDLPPFLSENLGGKVIFAPNGRLWVRRTVPPGQLPTFDVFDSEGIRLEQVTLPVGRRLVGFGKGSVYAICRDEFDLEFLERYLVHTHIQDQEPPKRDTNDLRSGWRRFRCQMPRSELENLSWLRTPGPSKERPPPLGWPTM